MRVAQIPPLYEAVPPTMYGGTERVVGHLTDALVALGHDVTLFGTAEAKTSARLIVVRDQALRLDPAPLKSDIAAHLQQLDVVRRNVRDFDVLHFHIDLLHLPLFTDVAARTVTTMHGRLDYKDLPGAFRRWARYPLVSISDNQRGPLPAANWVGTVHHGLPLELLRFTPRPSGAYVAFLGRISPEKGVDRAIAIARQAGVPLKIAAKIDPANVDYYRDVIKPQLDHPLFEYVGEIGDAEKDAFLGNALGLLFPIEWPEPFGLVMIESMACGTPVIALKRGSVPEVVEDGVSGLVVDSDEEAVAAIHAVGGLDRRRVRQAFERRFSVMTMAKKYLAIYEQLGRAGRPWRETA